MKYIQDDPAPTVTWPGELYLLIGLMSLAFIACALTGAWQLLGWLGQ